MKGKAKVGQAKPSVSYLLRKAGKGMPVFSDVTLPDGTVVRRVDRAVHERALRRVAERFKETAG